MELFHASRCEYKVGKVKEDGHESSFYPEATKLMDSLKPSEAPARKTSLYCADDKVFAAYYLKEQGENIDDIHLYKVKVDKFLKVPFHITAVVNRIFKSINDTEEFIDKNTEKLIHEYWNETGGWNNYEYLTPKFEVIEKIKTPKLNILMLMGRRDRDVDKATEILRGT